MHPEDEQLVFSRNISEVRILEDTETGLAEEFDGTGERAVRGASKSRPFKPSLVLYPDDIRVRDSPSTPSLYVAQLRRSPCWFSVVNPNSGSNDRYWVL